MDFQRKLSYNSGPTGQPVTTIYDSLLCPGSYFIHQVDHLQSQHILSQVIAKFEDDLHRVVGSISRVLIDKLQPERSLKTSQQQN